MNMNRILVVDDEPNFLELVCFFLAKTRRFEIRTERRAAEALPAALQFQPDLILLDVDMPGNDGGVVALQLRGQPIDRLLGAGACVL